MAARSSSSQKAAPQPAAPSVNAAATPEQQRLSAARGEVFMQLQSGSAEEALRACPRLLQQHERSLGPEHPDTLQCQKLHGAALLQLRRVNEAMAVFRDVLQSEQSGARGHIHPETLKSVNLLSGLLNTQGRYAEAEPMLRNVLAVNTRTLGPTHHTTLASQVHLGQCLMHMDSGMEEAVQLLHAAWLALMEDDSTGAEEVSESGCSLAKCLRQMDRHPEAEMFLRANVRWCRRLLGECNKDTVSSMVNHADCLQEMERYREAEVMYRLALTHYPALYGTGCRESDLATAGLAASLGGQGKVEQAESVCREYLGTMMQLRLEDDRVTSAWMRLLADYLEGQNVPSKTKEAKLWRKRAQKLESGRQKQPSD